ncbi:MAG: hypothetical protein EBR30_30420, partial [Cytophagia bacterium]|nr:hypothetical protein [Cytophagia bacterium]
MYVQWKIQSVHTYNDFECKCNQCLVLNVVEESLFCLSPFISDKVLCLFFNIRFQYIAFLLLPMKYTNSFSMSRILFLLCFIVVINKTNAQITMGLKLGGHMSTSATALPGFVQIESDGTQKVLLRTLGTGLDLNGFIFFDLTKNVAFGIESGYFNGFKIKFYQYGEADGAGNQSKTNYSAKGTFFNISPYVIIKANTRNNQGVIPYGRLGLHTGLANVTLTATTAGVQGKSVDKYTGNWSLGLISAAGFSISINKQASLFSEVTIKTIGFR